ncbi:MAG: histidine phosphatase family protein [Silicimonas sp.]|nr:histidine phosphatase family protein [Silicimonas sp.]
MTLKLILMRHAKSAWDNPMSDDFDRTLNERGRRSAPLIASWLVEKGHLPQSVVVSSARRTLETWDRMASQLGKDTTVEATRALYLASPDMILRVIQGQSTATVMVICHNPGIAECAARLLGDRPDHPKFGQYPTAATSVIAFKADTWADVTWCSGTLVDFAVPRDLET